MLLNVLMYKRRLHIVHFELYGNGWTEFLNLLLVVELKRRAGSRNFPLVDELAAKSFAALIIVFLTIRSFFQIANGASLSLTNPYYGLSWTPF
jgi:hypothetical protein